MLLPVEVTAAAAAPVLLVVVLSRAGPASPRWLGGVSFCRFAVWLDDSSTSARSRVEEFV
jgi:hypothetical protein